MKNRMYLRHVLGYAIVIFCSLIMFTVSVVWTDDAVAQTSFGDPFDGNGLQNSNWKWQNEPETWDVGKTKKDYLFIDSQTDRNIWANDASHFLYQETDTDMFDVETRFFARWNTNSAVNGLLVKSPADDNWVTIKFWARDANAKAQIQYQRKQAGMGPGDVHWLEKFGDFQDVDIALRLKKEGDTYTAWYQTADDNDWVSIGQGTFALNPPLWLGIYAGVADPTGTLEVEYEYFRDNMNPFPVEPGGKATTTWGAVKTRY